MGLTPEEISDLYTQHARTLLRFFMRRTYDEQVSLDLVGETFAQAFENRASYRGEGAEFARSWLFGIGNNLLKDYYRSGNVERRAMERMHLTRTEPTQSEIDEIEELSELESLREEVREAINQLPSGDKDAIRMRVVEQQSYAAVAKHLGVSEQAARARLSRALQRLRSLIESERAKHEVRRA